MLKEGRIVLWWTREGPGVQVPHHVSSGAFRPHLAPEEGTKGIPTEQFFEDMVCAGIFIGDQNIVEVVTFTACDRILDMERYGVKFRKYEDGRFYQTPMPGQTYPRSCFMYENGQHMFTVLAKEVSRHKNITVYKDFFVFGLLKNDGVVVGIIGIDMISGQIITVNAKSTVIATGGYTSLWGFSDNPPTLTVDSLSMAFRAGAELVDL
ncbi:hypothetical protein DRJ04_09910 [Candidatus Aerophobetes bacterium]|uniref:FAD-dependent oxidoreductase 2 FAD-binding domain-containing protein n=1 Tax=Aerophobetes bacterium TaxID=2030807 RepID=A0A662D325_UNCAE|nr:MAG: hypothetical protein DRJ04_09910 [Candidatus Aerophobetes bacterium]